MTAERVTRNDGWTCFRGGNGDAATNTATSDLINILDTVEFPIVVVRRDLMLACFNKAAAEVLGLSPSDIGRACTDISGLAGLSQLEEQCRQAITGGVESRADFRNAQQRFVVRISSYTDGDRPVAGAVLTFTNVTAFRASIDQAIYERECTKVILNTVEDPLVVLSADQRIQSGNRAFYTMFGVSRNETQGVPLYGLANGAFELVGLRQQLKELLEGAQVFQPVEVDQVVTANGPRTLILHAHPLSFPGHSERRVLVTFQDITARKQAEEAKDLRSEEELRRNEAFLAEGQRLSLTGSFSWKVATGEITWSDQLYRIFEFDKNLPVTLERIGARVHPEDAPLLDDMIDRARRGVSHFEYEHRLLMPDQSVKYLHLIAHGSRDTEGRVEYIGASQDVTQRRSSEEALAKARFELAHVARVTTLGTLTASIAHEVNQPLAGIMTNAGTCIRMLDADPPNLKGARETARRTIRDANRASEVMTRLRSLFRKKEGAIESVGLNETAQEVIALSSSELQRHRVILRLEFDKDIPPVTGDRFQLQQVILNLLLNALEAMSNVADRPRELLIRTERDAGDQVRLSVKDAGVGFEQDAMDRLFDAFYTTKSDGMGIGLSVSRSIVDSHRGRLWATANDGPGATFSFSIPCRSGGSSAAA